MRTVLLASLRIHFRRYVAAAVAVIASVAFVVATGVLVAGARSGLMKSDGAPYRSADYVVRAKPVAPGKPSRAPACCPGTLDTSAAIGFVDRLGDNAAGLGRVLLPAFAGNGKPLDTGNARGETTAGPIAAAPELRWQKLVAGRFPARPGEAVVHVWDARAWDIAVGDRIRLGAGSAAIVLEVVGLVESPSTWTQASVYVTWPQYLAWRHQPTFNIGTVAVRGDVGRLPEGMLAQPAQAYVADSVAGLDHGVDAFGLMLLLFAGVALFVSALVIANTFSILFAQRLRDFAMLRCLGATRRQVLGAVRLEAAAVGVLASLAGMLTGSGIGYGLLALIGLLAPRTPMGVPALPLPWLAGGFAAGLLVTMSASWWPARGVVRTSPLAALRPDVALDVRTSAGHTQSALAALLLSAGPALLAMAVIRAGRVSMVAGGACTFIGILMLGPMLVPWLVRMTGALLGTAGRLATANAVRNPRRTATTAAALLCSVTLTTTLLTGMGTWRAALGKHRDRQLPIDVTLTSSGRPLAAGLLERVRRVPGVARAIVVKGTMARIDGWEMPIPLVAAPDAARVARDGGAFARVEPGTIRLDHEVFRSPRTKLALQPGDRVAVRAGDHRAELKAVLLGGWGRAGIVAPETLARLTDAPEPRVIWIRAAAGVDPLQLVGALDRLARAAGVEIDDRLQARAAGNRQLDILTWSMLGLLGISVAIALVGIANTLALSVLERAREHALLRALGLTRGQLQRLLATEAMLLSVVATLLGTALGTGFGWVACATVVKPILADAALRIPWLALGTGIFASALAGLLASLLPARRAARATPSAGLSLD